MKHMASLVTVETPDPSVLPEEARGVIEPLPLSRYWEITQLPEGQVRRSGASE